MSNDSNNEKRTVADGTDAVHAGEPETRPFHSLTAGIAQTATFTFADSADLARYMRGEDPDPHREEYGRYGNPTVREVELRLAALEGTEDALLFGSGMSAISTAVLALVKSGDHVVLFQDCYRRTRQLVTTTLARLGITHTLIPSADLDALSQAILPETKLVISESPTNPYLSCVDLTALAQTTKSRNRKARVLVDSTFATPINTRPAAFGVDLVVHSATKYLAGHNDVLAGSLAGPSHLVSLIRDLRGILGGVCDPHAAFLVGRGMKTLALRVARQNETALRIAKELGGHPKIKHIYYPLLETHPTYGAARAQMVGGGGVVSFVVAGGRAAASRFIDGCRLAKIAPSLGGVETLIEQPALMSFAELDDEALLAVGIDPALIRLSVGIEESGDILSDLTTALSNV